jgi:hypothetical protein
MSVTTWLYRTISCCFGYGGTHPPRDNSIDGAAWLGSHPKCIEVRIIIVYVERTGPVIYGLDGITVT